MRVATAPDSSGVGPKPSFCFPKTARLLKRSDFQFRPYHRFLTRNFTFIFTSEGTGRLGVSLSKKVLRRAVARNRVKRLLKEVFREMRADVVGLDIHVIGSAPLKGQWETLNKALVKLEFEQFLERSRRSPS